MAGQHADDGIDVQGTALKRRGLIAGAAALVAGIVATRTSEPVAAAANLVLESTANTEATGTGLMYTGAFTLSGAGLSVIDNGGASLDDVPGAMVAGVASTKANHGVYGRHKGFGNGVHGVAGAGGNGVFGTSSGSASSFGMFGQTAQGKGVVGQSFTGDGVYGSSVSANASDGNGVSGFVGHVGATKVVAGVLGDSTASYGVIGRTTAAGYSGLTAITSTAGVAALAATSTVSTAFAAYFSGATVVQGDFTVVGGVKSAAVKDATGQHRLVYCIESPESWFEDFGKGQLVNGHADVALDKTFAQIAHTADYHVFLTTYGPSQGVDVVSQDAGGFTVQERNKGNGNIAFGYRVVARRADIKGERLAKFDLPKISHPDPDKLPKPEPPKKA